MPRRARKTELSKLAGAPGGIGRVVRVLPGSFHVTDDPDLTLVTVLGSCVAACIRNPWTGFGGLNHFMLPEGSAADGITGETPTGSAISPCLRWSTRFWLPAVNAPISRSSFSAGQT